jgi:hypothetical protein
MSFERQLKPAQLLGPKGAANAALSLKAADATSRRCSMPGLRMFITQDAIAAQEMLCARLLIMTGSDVLCLPSF